MKRLYLLRHAKSTWDDPTLTDRDRPLAPRAVAAPPGSWASS
jgi:phosphohistidine phosphatase